MRLRIIQNVDKVTIVDTTIVDGKIKAQQFESVLVAGKVRDDVVSIQNYPNGTSDIHLNNGTVMVNVPTSALEERGDKPANKQFPRFCCNERS